MRLKIRNCVTDPEKKALRQKGQGVMRPLIMGDVLAPGAIRMVAATDMTKADVDNLDFLVKNHSCTALVVGQGFLPDCGPLYDFLGFNQDVPAPAVEVATPEVEEPVAEEVLEEEPAVTVEEVEEPSEDVQEGPTYTESELKNMKNADLRDIATLLVEDAQVGGLSKKKLVAFILENQNA